MFSEIEKDYRKGLQEARFWRFYGWRSLVAIVLAMVVIFVLGVNSWLVAGCLSVILVGLVAWFFWKDTKIVLGKRVQRKSVIERLVEYFREDDKLRVKNLLVDLKRHGVQTREEIKIALDYYERKQPVQTKTGILEWVLSVAVALVSIVVVAYDEASATVDMEKLFNILKPTLGLIVAIIIPIVVARMVVNFLAVPRAKLDSILVEDLAIIYMQYDKFEDKLK